jgi:hypothetical protein
MCTPEGCVSLLSLIPHLIMQPFPVREGVVGVAGWNTSTAEVPSIAGGCHVCGGGRRRARTLLGPEETPCGCCSRCRSRPGRPNAFFVDVVAVWGLGCGCVLSVA